MPMLTDLADTCRRSGLPVVEEPGWRARGHGQMSGVRCVVLHHTAGPEAGDAPSLRVVRDGRADLPGPLAQLVLARSGIVHVVAAGRCWHTGATFETWQSNPYAVGIEAEHTGRADDPWPQAQYDAYVRLARALADHYQVPYARVLGHKEIAKPRGRKVDPTFDCAAFRAALGQSGDVSGPASLPTLREGDTGEAVHRWQAWLNRMFPSYARIDLGPRRYGPQTVEATAEFQRRVGITGADANGTVVGPRTNSAAWRLGYRG